MRRLRRAARRLEHRRPGGLRWTVLVSVLGHVVALALVKLLAPPPAAPTPLLVLERWAVAPAPDEPPAQVPHPREAQRFARARAPTEAPAAPTELISDRDQRGTPPAPQRHHPADGPTETAQAVGRHAGGYRTHERRPGELGSRRGGPRHGPDALARGHRGGGGHAGPSSSDRASHRGHAPEVGGRPARGLEGPRRAAAAALHVPRRTRDLPWWKPLAARVAPLPAPTRSPDTEALSVVATGEAAAPQRRRGRAVQARVAPVTVLPRPDAPHEHPGAEPRPVPSPLGDPIAELREALGFGPLDRDRLAARPAWAGERLAQGLPSTSPSTPDDLPATFTTAQDARGTPLGRWLADAEDRILDRWLAVDLSAHDRAVGIQGEVTVRYRTERNGRVTQVEVERSSGLPRLDALAVSAIPPRLPRIPRAAAHDAVYHRITLRYRNPLVQTTP